MAQWTVSIDPEFRRPDATCEVRVRTSATNARGEPLYVTLTVRDGDTILTDDPVVTAALNSLRTGGKVVTTLAARPANPTHDVDTKQRDPLPDLTVAAEKAR